MLAVLLIIVTPVLIVAFLTVAVMTNGFSAK